MDKCCRTCKWFRGGFCEHEEMMIKCDQLEEVISDIFLEVKADAKESYLREVVQGFENVIISRIEDVKFEPFNISEFYCKHYE